MKVLERLVPLLSAVNRVRTELSMNMVVRTGYVLKKVGYGSFVICSK